MDEPSPEELERGGYVCRIHSLDGDDWGAVTHPAPDLSTGDLVLVNGVLCEVTRFVEAPVGAPVRRLSEVSAAR